MYLSRGSIDHRNSYTYTLISISGGQPHDYGRFVFVFCYTVVVRSINNPFSRARPRWHRRVTRPQRLFMISTPLTRGTPEATGC